ncbi:MAG: GNAT family N-acetyltransferase [Gemmatimonadaceae bacterium]
MTPSDGVTIRGSTLASPEARELIAALDAELSALYPEPGATHFRLDTSEVAEGQGAFLVATLDDKPIGCGAIRRIDERTGEIKRMYVRPAARGRGVGRDLLRALETEARALGLTRVALETGARQLEALALYQHAGFAPIPPFGEYVGSPTSVCMAKDL